MEKFKELDLEKQSSNTKNGIPRRDFLRGAIASICLAGNFTITSLLEGCARKEDPFAHFDAREQLQRLPYREYYENDPIDDTADPIDMDKAKPFLNQLFEKGLNLDPNGLQIEDLIDCTITDEGTSFKIKNLSQQEFFEIIKKYRENEDFTVEIIFSDEISITISTEDSENFEHIWIRNVVYTDDDMIIKKETPDEVRILYLHQKDKTLISTKTVILKRYTENGENGEKITRLGDEKNINAVITSNGYLIIFQKTGVSISKDNEPIFTEINDSKTLIKFLTIFKKYPSLLQQLEIDNTVANLIINMIKSVKNLDELKILMECFDGNYNIILNRIELARLNTLEENKIYNPALRYSITSLNKFLELIQIIPKNPKIFSAIMKTYGPEYRAWDNDSSPTMKDQFRDPIETFKSGWADCDDFAVINYSWAYANRYNPQFKETKDHVLVWYLDEKNQVIILDNDDTKIMSEGLTVEDYLKSNPYMSNEDWAEFLRTDNKEPLPELNN